jgi:hypothetical protein
MPPVHPIKLRCFDLEFDQGMPRPTFLEDHASGTWPLAALLNLATYDSETENSIAARQQTEPGNAYWLPVAGPADNDRYDLYLRKLWKDRSGEDAAPYSVAFIARPESSGDEEPLAVPWEILKEGIQILRDAARNWQPAAGPLLFTSPAISPRWSPEDLELIQKLEAELESIDFAAEATQKAGLPEGTALIHRRQAFLRAVTQAGLFSSRFYGERLECLGRGGGTRLQDLQKACQLLRDWGFLPSDAESPAASPVCLDYARFRAWPWPARTHGGEWAREQGLEAMAAVLDPQTTGDEGVIKGSGENPRLLYCWRRDGDRPALLAILAEGDSEKEGKAAPEPTAFYQRGG